MVRRKFLTEREIEKIESLRCPYCGSLACKCRPTVDDYEEYDDEEYDR